MLGVWVSLTLCQKVVNSAGGIFLPGGENLRMSDFDNSKIFQNYKQHFVNTEPQLKSTLAWSVFQKSIKLKQNGTGAMTNYS